LVWVQRVKNIIITLTGTGTSGSLPQKKELGSYPKGLVTLQNTPKGLSHCKGNQKGLSHCKWTPT
jgi:hypothetical protein